MLKYNPLEVASMSAKLLWHTANNGLLKSKPSQCLNRGIDFIDKRATFSIEIDFKPSVDSKRVKLGLF